MSKRNARKYYIVEGESTFPIDMLRYDQSWPHSEAKDIPYISHHPYQEPMEKRRVMLATDAVSSPNGARWKSFGWRVIVVSKAAYDAENFRDMNMGAAYVS